MTLFTSIPPSIPESDLAKQQNSSIPLAIEPPPTPLYNSEGNIVLNVATEEKVSLYDQLGPTVVGTDGKLSKISNWAEFGEVERANVLRVLGKRNAARLEKLKSQMSEKEVEN